MVLDQRPELAARLARLTREISQLEVEYATTLSYYPLEGGYVCPRCGLRVRANECGRSWAYVGLYGGVGCCEDCMHEMLRDPDKRVADAMRDWKVLDATR
jgi:hypothetical protein